METERKLFRRLACLESKDHKYSDFYVLTEVHKKETFYRHIDEHRNTIAELIAHHLNISPSDCRVEARENWLGGGFNVGVPVTVVAGDNNNASQRVLIRFPLPYRVGEQIRPGNADEKVRCEAATYAWISQECPSIPIPHLYGFALSTGQLFTSRERLPFFVRLWHSMKCTFRALFRLPLPSRLIQHPSTITNPLGPYVLVEYIEKANGTMLSDVWEDTYDRDRELRMNLFRNLAKINIDLTRKPLPRIGSFTIDDGGFLQLENRPLSADSTNVEADGRCLDIPRNRVYHTVDSYVNGLIHVHDHYLRHRRRLAGEIVYRMSALTMMRAISHHFFERSLNHGPFYLGLTDVHPVNILVDDKWNIMCLTDLEWASSQPLEFIQPPWWLIMELADQTCPDGYNEHLKEFLEMQEEEELKSCVAQTHPMMCSSVMKRTWESGAFWYILALQSLAGLNPLFYDRIKPLFCNRDGRFFWYTHQYWTRDATAFRRRIYGKMFGNNKRPNKEIGIEDDELCEKNDKPLEVFKSV